MRLVAVLALCSACATQELPPRQAEHPGGSCALDLRSETPGECEPAELTLQSAKPHDVVVRVAVSPRGFAADATLKESTGSRADDLFALDVMEHVFHCRNPLSVSASRAIDYPIHFRSAAAPKLADPDKCVGALRHPTDRPYPSNAAPLDLRIALDDQGSVLQAWSAEDDAPWFLSVVIEALEHRCRFQPQQIEGKSVAYVFPYTLDFAGDRIFDRVYPQQEHWR